MEKLFHYTSLDTLALILKGKNIRFNSLSNVDDLEESVDDNGHDIGGSVLISCWTDSSVENIPLWKMYSNDFCGCRIELKKGFFEIEEMFTDIGDKVVSLTDISKDNGGLFIIPQYFGGKIKYKQIFSKRELFSNEALCVNLLGKEKKEEWSFQSEYRFYMQQLPKLLNKELVNVEYKYKEYYLELSDESINNIIVRLGPKCNFGHKLIVDALIKEYTKNGMVEWSTLKDKIK